MELKFRKAVSGERLSALLQDTTGSNAHAHVWVALLVASYSQICFIFYE